MSRPCGARGFTLIDVLLALAIAGLALLVTVPPLMRASGRGRVELAAAELVGVLRQAQALARKYGTHVAVKFRREDGGRTSYAIYRDGNGDGVLTDDIRRGIDPQLVAPQLLGGFGRGVGLGFPPGPPPRDPGDPGHRLDRLDDPIRFNSSDLASFGPLGESTPGSLYLTDGVATLVAVRVFGRTGKVKVIVYDAASETWR